MHNTHTNIYICGGIGWSLFNILSGVFAAVNQLHCNIFTVFLLKNQAISACWFIKQCYSGHLSLFTLFIITLCCILAGTLGLSNSYEP